MLWVLGLSFFPVQADLAVSGRSQLGGAVGAAVHKTIIKVPVPGSYAAGHHGRGYTMAELIASEAAERVYNKAAAAEEKRQRDAEDEVEARECAREDAVANALAGVDPSARVNAVVMRASVRQIDLALTKPRSMKQLSADRAAAVASSTRAAAAALNTSAATANQLGCTLLLQAFGYEPVSDALFGPPNDGYTYGVLPPEAADCPLLDPMLRAAAKSGLPVAKTIYNVVVVFLRLWVLRRMPLHALTFWGNASDAPVDSKERRRPGSKSGISPADARAAVVRAAVETPCHFRRIIVLSFQSNVGHIEVLLASLGYGSFVRGGAVEVVSGGVV